MAIAVQEGAAEIVSTSAATNYDFPAATLPGDAVVVVLAMVRVSVAAGAVTTVSGDALTWTKKGSATFNAGADTAYCFWAKTPTTPVSSVYRVNVAGDAGTGCIAYMFAFTGADLLTADPIRQLATNSGTSTNPTATFGAAKDTLNGYCAAWMGALSSSNPANVSTPPTGWTEIGDNGFATPTSNGSGAFRAGGETTTGVTFTAASTTWGMIAAEVYVAGAGPVPEVTGTGDVAIGAPALAATGTVTEPEVTGTGAVTIGAPALAGSGTTGTDEVTGTGTVVIGRPALAATGAFATTGTGTVVIGRPALAATGAFATTGSGALTIGRPALAASGTFTPAAITGTGALAIAAPSIAATGTAGAPGAITGTGAVSIGRPALAATGAFATTGAGSVSIGRPALAAAGIFTTTGTGAISIGRPLLAASGAFTPQPITGTGAILIGPPLLAASGSFVGAVTGLPALASATVALYQQAGATLGVSSPASAGISQG